MNSVLDARVVLLRTAFLATLAPIFQMESASYVQNRAILARDRIFAICVIMDTFLYSLLSLTMKLLSTNAFLAIIHALVALIQSILVSLAPPTLRWWVRSA